MILRKPYAFFIKYFKLLHLVMAILIAFLIYRTGILLSFFNLYVDDYRTAMTNFNVGSVINIYSFLIALAIIIMIIIVLSVMFVKNKPKLMYVCNLLLYIGVTVFFVISYDTLRDVSVTILDTRVSRALRDITLLFLLLEVVSLILMLVRATGFDIKKFDFGTDIQSLQISEKDSEEIEVAVEFDKNKARRNFRACLRNAKYVYVEHKFVINLSIVIVMLVFVFWFYFTTSIYSANYKENKYFSASSVTMGITDSYYMATDYNGNTIDDDLNLVVIKFDVKRNYIDTKILNTGIFTLKIGNHSYGQVITYNQKVSDLGTGYVDQELTDEYQSFILTFAVPKNVDVKKAELKINDNVSYVNGQMGAKNIFIKLDIENLDENEKENNNKIGETIDFSGSIFKNSSFTVKELSIANKFRNEYNFCASKDYCYNSYEYIVPTATGNYVKTLMRFAGELKLDENVKLPGINSMTDFFNKFAYIEYQKQVVSDDGQSKIQTVTEKISSQIIKTANGDNSVYYIEIPRDVLTSEKINLIFKVRQMKYNYTLK